MKNHYLTIVFASLSFLILSCSYSKVQNSGIDSQMQKSAIKILKKQLPYAMADSGLILVMEVKNGKILANASVALNDSSFKPSEGEKMSNALTEPGTIFLPIAMMAALEKGKISMDDSIDTGYGLYEYRGGTLMDALYSKGSHGKITREQSIAVSSNIGVIKTVEKVFGDSNQNLTDQLEKISVGEPLPELVFENKSLFDRWLGIGNEIKLSPIQIITFYNAIANNGKMVYEGKVLNQQVAKKKTIEAIQDALEKGGCNYRKFSKIELHKILFAGKSGSTHIPNVNPVDKKFETSDMFSFCGYFPVDNPKYTCLVMIYRSQESVLLGGSGAYPIFNKIINKIIDKSNYN